MRDKQRKANTKGYLLYDYTHVNFKNRENKSMVIEAIEVISSVAAVGINREVALENIRELLGH